MEDGSAEPHAEIVGQLKVILKEVQHQKAVSGAAPVFQIQGLPAEFDLPKYLAPYSPAGPGILNRLLHIANAVHPKELKFRTEVHRLLLQELKSGWQQELYQEVLTRIPKTLAAQLGELAIPDQVWIKNRSVFAAERGARLQEEVELQKREGESHEVARALLTAIKFRAQIGDWKSVQELLAERQSYVRGDNEARLENRLLAIEACILDGPHNRILQEVRGASSLPAAQRDPILRWKLAAAAGLHYLLGRRLREAALEFLNCEVGLGDHWSQIIVPRDIAIYVCLGALKHFTRAQIQERILRNPKFKKFLELTPELRSVLQHYHRSEYRECFALLDSLRGRLKLDVFIGKQVDSVIETVRDNAVCLYFKPFVAIHIPQMAEAFDTPIQELEKRLLRLIDERKISARIDSAQKVLYSRSVDDRSSAFQRSLQVADQYLRNGRTHLLQMSLAEQRLQIEAESSPEERSSSGRSSGRFLQGLLRG